MITGTRNDELTSLLLLLLLFLCFLFPFLSVGLDGLDESASDVHVWFGFLV